MGLDEDNKKYFNSVMKDCAHFNGYKPCTYIKNQGAKCNSDCKFYKQIKKKILIIKRSAAGEVIRNTPILHIIKKDNPFIVWITDYPDLIPKECVDLVLKYSVDTVTMLENMNFDIVYSLDKEAEACSLANKVKAKLKKGFKIDESGKISVYDEDALYLWRNGIDDEFMKKNKKHYVEEMFETCGFKFSGEKYILPKFPKVNLPLNKNKKLIGLNVGVGNVWVTRLYTEDKWKQVAQILVDKGYEVVILGGPEEDEKSKRIAMSTGAKYFGFKPFNEFLGLVDECDVVVTCVTLCLHIAIGLEKKIVLLNNIFNKNEFYMYGKGIVLEPNLPCLMCYKTKFDSKCPTKDCMDLITPEKIINAVEELLKQK